ncbi:MAG: PDZ domain-containing protein, partial [Candidatus Eiseniibacteriota bacterium]
PGEHGPSGPVQNLAGITIAAGKRVLAWRRDPEEMFAIHCDVPTGVRSVDVTLDYLIPPEGGRGSATQKVAVLNWNEVLFYPDAIPAESLLVRATLRLPTGWKWGTALPVDRSSGSEIWFRPAPLTTLIDSPVLAGAYFRAIPLAPEISPHHEIDIAADTPSALEADSKAIEHLSRLVREALALYGVPHYREYHFLYALSDRMLYSGLEHHESSDNRCPEGSVTDSDLLVRTSQLLAHEFSHSWCGKYRRPADLATKPYLAPMHTDLLWVYEGLDDYLAVILAARSGLQTLDQGMADLAMRAASMSYQSGRSWRSLRDMAESEPMPSSAGRAWRNGRRTFGDVYDEGALIWLDADAVIRNQTGGKKSLDDFIRLFFGGEASGPMIKTYDLDTIVGTLNRVAPHDWAGFFEARVNRVAPTAPLGGIEGEGWKLAYVDSIDPYFKVFERARKWVFLNFSLGLLMGTDGSIIDVNPTMPAAKAGMAPGDRILAVNGRAWSASRCRDALDAAKRSSKPIEFVVQSGDFISTCRVDYHGGERYPKLIRDPAKPDYLTANLTPKTASR